MAIPVIATVLYVFLVLGVAYRFRHHENSEEFLIQGHQAGLWPVASSIFTLIGGGELATLTSLAFVFGGYGIFLFVGYFFGFLALALIARTIRADLEGQKYHTITDYVYHRIGKLPGIVTVVVTFAAFFALLIIQIAAGAAILKSLYQIPYIWGVLLTGTIVLVYLYIGGFKTVMMTDVLQGGIMLVLLIIIVVFLLSQHGVPSFAPSKEGIGAWLTLSFVATGFFVVASSGDIWQRIYASRSTEVAQKGLVIGAILFMVVGFGLVYIGVLARPLDPAIVPDDSFVVTMTRFVPPGLNVVVLLLIFASIMSTADTEIFLLGSVVSREYNRWKGGYTEGSDIGSLTTIAQARWAIVAIVLLSTLVSIYISSLVTVYLMLLSMLLVISPAVLTRLLFGERARWLDASIYLSLVCFLGLWGSGHLNPENAFLIIIPGALIALAGTFSRGYNPASG
jgi:Na+/proline symporter